MEFRIGKKIVGGKHSVFVVAEISANHVQKYDLAVKTIKVAKESGADAVKLQTYTPDGITLKSDSPYFRIRQGTVWDGRTLYDLYCEAHTPWEWQPKLKKIAEDLGLVFFSSPFDRNAVDFLEKMDVPAFKIASFEITDIPLIEYAASRKKPIIISTGVATLSDIWEAIHACRRVGNEKIALLKCTSSYPSPLEDMNLKTILDMKKRFQCVIGLSDHTLNTSVPCASVALGAKIVEKHIILDRKLGGPDALFSLEPDEFRKMVNAVRDVEKAIGSATYILGARTKKNREFSRSLFVTQHIQKGEVFTEKNVRSIRPGFGLSPKFLKKILGKKASKDITRGTPLMQSMVK